MCVCCATGAEQLKVKLSQLGLKCGGTVKQRAERLYAIKGKRWGVCVLGGGVIGRM